MRYWLYKTLGTYPAGHSSAAEQKSPAARLFSYKRLLALLGFRLMLMGWWVNVENPPIEIHLDCYNDAMNDRLFMLRITAYSPETIPMNRLAEYMLHLAGLMGSEACVHFKGVRKGSTILRAEVDHEDLPKVRERLSKVGGSDVPDNVLRPFNALNSLLRADNSSATLKHGNAQIIKFPGCDMPVAQRIGPVKEFGQLEGIVISVGGKDDTKHIRMLGQDGEEYKLTTRSIELAKKLANNLFSLVRVSGAGTWYRNEESQWDLDNFIVQSCEPLEERSLVEAVAALRGLNDDGWKTFPDPLAVWHELRRN